MNYIEATYLLTSKEKIQPQQEVDKIIDFLSLSRTPLPVKLGEVEDFYDTDLKVYKVLFKVQFPVSLFRHDLYSILSLTYGEMILPYRIKLIDIDFPPAFLDHFKGANYGIKGIQDYLEIHHRPLLISTIRPAIGLKKEEIGEIFESLIDGGMDIVREDELFFNEGFAPFESRIDYLSQLKAKLQEKHSRKIVYAPFLSGNLEEIENKINFAVQKHIRIFVLNLFPLGFETVRYLSEKFEVGFILNLSYPSFFFENDDFGIQPDLLFGKLTRLSGGDMVLIPSPYRYKNIPHFKSVEIAESLREDFENIRPVYPVLYGDIYPHDLYKIFEDFGNLVAIDIGNNYQKHKAGITAGAKAYFDTLNCVVNSISLEECKSLSKELKEFK